MNCYFCKKKIFLKENKYKNYKKRFCNKFCYAKYMTIRPKNESPRWIGNKIKCDFCGKEFFRIKARVRYSKAYCSRKCRDNFIKIFKPYTLEKSANWRGGRTIGGKNTVLIKKPSHPNCFKNGYVPEHRLVVSNAIGRPLKHDEDVHHIDGNRKNNKLNNLLLLSHSEHSSLHNKGLKKRRKNEY